MKAIGFKTSHEISHQDSFIEFETKKPQPKGRDLLIKVQAVSVNPVDFKVRQGSAKGKVLETPKVIGWDAVGIVEAVGDQVSLFKIGDAVYYAGDITRPGSNAAFQLVDERIVGRKPENSSIAQAAAMPLTTITAWETLFDRLHLKQGEEYGKSILIIGGAGGVGSIAIQLAKQLTELKVITTASREETTTWTQQMGADVVVNHRDLQASMKAAGIEQVDYIANFANTEMHWQAMAALIKPQGAIASIVETQEPLNMNLLKNKSVSFSWELMFTRSMFQTDDMIEQHYLLNKIADLMDKGIIKSTLTTIIQGFSTDSFKEAHIIQETGKAIGKTVITF